MRERLLCIYCEKPIRRADNDHATITTYSGATGIERAWHRACHPNTIPDDSPVDAAILHAKHAFGLARRLPAEDFNRFRAAVLLLIAEPESL